MGVFVRRFSERDYLALKRAPDVAYDLAGGPSLVQHGTRVVVSQLSKYASEQDDHLKTFMPIDVAVDVDRAAKSPVITSRMAEMLGFRLVPLDEAVKAEPGLSEGDALQIMDEATELWRMTRAAFADGRIDALEKKTLCLQLHQLIRAAGAILEKLERI